MSTTWKAIENGDSISAADMDINFDAMETLINTLSPGDLVVGSLHRAHLPNSFHASATVSLDTDDHNYTNSDSPYGRTTASSWTRINSAGGSGTSSDDFKLDSIGIELTSSGIETPRNGVLVFFNALIKNIENAGANTGYTGYHDVYAIFQLIVTDGSGNEKAITRSERFADSELSWYHGIAEDNLKQWKFADISIRHLITSNDVTDGTLDKIEVGIAVVQGTTVPSTDPHHAECTLTHCNLSYISLNNQLTEY